MKWKRKIIWFPPSQFPQHLSFCGKKQNTCCICYAWLQLLVSLSFQIFSVFSVFLENRIIYGFWIWGHMYKQNVKCINFFLYIYIDLYNLKVIKKTFNNVKWNYYTYFLKYIQQNNWWQFALLRPWLRDEQMYCMKRLFIVL